MIVHRTYISSFVQEYYTRTLSTKEGYYRLEFSYLSCCSPTRYGSRISRRTGRPARFASCQTHCKSTYSIVPIVPGTTALYCSHIQRSASVRVIDILVCTMSYSSLVIFVPSLPPSVVGRRQASLAARLRRAFIVICYLCFLPSIHDYNIIIYPLPVLLYYYHRHQRRLSHSFAGERTRESVRTYSSLATSVHVLERRNDDRDHDHDHDHDDLEEWVSCLLFVSQPRHGGQ
jgi:hypothetical protein